MDHCVLSFNMGFWVKVCSCVILVVLVQCFSLYSSGTFMCRILMSLGGLGSRLEWHLGFIHGSNTYTTCLSLNDQFYGSFYWFDSWGWKCPGVASLVLLLYIMFYFFITFFGKVCSCVMLIFHGSIADITCLSLNDQFYVLACWFVSWGWKCYCIPFLLLSLGLEASGTGFSS